jgi:transcriptional regulator with XRE-family HTH domain
MRGVRYPFPAPEPLMAFPDRLVSLRKAKGLTQQALAERVGLHVMQIYRYESGASQPTLDVIRKLSVELGVSADQIVFDSDERGPDEELRLAFEAISRFDPDDKKVARAVLEGLILKHEAKRWAATG